MLADTKLLTHSLCLPVKYFFKEKFLVSGRSCNILYLLHYRGGKICMTDHFKPLWGRNVPKFGIAHAMALGVSASLATC